MKTLITGASGFLGRQLCRRLDDLVIVSRDPDRALRRLGFGDRRPAPTGPSPRAHAWDPMSGPLPAASLEGVEAVVHLAGESVAAGRWTAERKRRIRESRVLGTRHLVDGLAASRARAEAASPRVLVCASAVGYYGDRADEVLDESAASGTGFLAELCRDWEDEARRAVDLGIRVVRARIGVVLGKDGGALARMLPMFRRGLGGRLGSGRQWMPWIHVSDACGVILQALPGDGIAGPINVVAPEAARNVDFTRELARCLGRPAWLPVPAPLLRLAMGEFAGVLLASQRARPAGVLRAGYRFAFPGLADALADLLARS